MRYPSCDLATVRRGLVRLSRARDCAVSVAALSVAMLAVQSPALADWVNAGGVIYKYYDSGNGGRVMPPHQGTAATAIYGSTVVDPFGNYVDYDNLNLTQAAAIIFDQDFVGGGFPRDYISLPGNPANGDPGATSYVVVGVSGSLIVPQSGVNDVRITEWDNVNERAWVYASNKIVADPVNYNWVFGGPNDPTDDFDRILYWGFTEAMASTNNVFSLWDAGFQNPVQALLIQGRDVFGTSYGFDLMSVAFEGTSLQNFVIPEPGSVILMGLGALGLVAWRAARRARRHA